MLRRILLTLIFILTFTVTGWASTYYVDQNCANNITTYEPTGHTCTGGSYRVFSTLQNANDYAGLSAGDTVIAVNGTYTSALQYILKITKSGSAGNYIIFRAENKWGAVLDGQNNTTDYCWIFDSNANYIRVEDFEVKGCDWGGFWSNEGADYIYFYRNKIHDIGRKVDCNLACCSGTCTCGKAGVYQGVYSTNYTYDSNIFYNIGRYSSGCTPESEAPWKYYNHDHALYLCSDDVLIKNNIFYDNTSGFSVKISGAYESDGVSNWQIINNTFYNYNSSFPTYEYDFGHILVWGKCNNILIQNNVSHTPGKAFVKQYGSHSDDTVDITYNLMYGSGYQCSAIDETKSCVTPTGWTFSNNIENQNPEFVDLANKDFHLLSSSPAVNNGYNVSSITTVDYEGDTRPQPANGIFDIGADEYVIPASTSRTYYISNSGNDNNDGESKASAWKTLAKVNGYTMQGNDTYRFKGGDTFQAQLLVHDSGTSGNPITFTNYDSGRPIINTIENLINWTETTGSGSLTVYSTDADTILREQYPDINYGDDTECILQDGTNIRKRPILKFDFSSLPSGATITSANVSCYYWDYLNTSPAGLTAKFYRLTQTGWTELGATWNKYDGTNAWASIGGDYTTTDGAAATIPSSVGLWVNWNVTILAQYAQANVNEILHGLIRFETESSTQHSARFKSSEEAGTTYDPKLVIDYTTGTSNVYKKTSISVAPTKMWFDSILGTEDSADCGVTTPNANNEWCYKSATSELYIYSTTNPTGRTIQRDYPYGVDVNGKSYIILENLEVKNAGTAGIRMNGTNGTLRQCNIHDNTGDNILVNGNNNKVGMNIVYDATDDCISVEGGTGIEVDNNVLYSCDGDGIQISGTGTTATLKNNISTGHTGSTINKTSGTGTITINKNDYMPSTGTPFMWEGVAKNFTDWKTACSCDANSYNADPLFVNATNKNFHLLQGSPCVNTGDTISWLLIDYDGVTLTGQPDIGAFAEYFPPMSMNAIFCLGMEF
ncbi:MAG: DNRLRE domain-containing protein [Bacillota bacterium]